MLSIPEHTGAEIKVSDRQRRYVQKEKNAWQEDPSSVWESLNDPH
jgi:hypothetical protein